MISLKDLLNTTSLSEGVHDPGVLKAVFLAGGPGSGKSTVANDLFGVTSYGFTVGGLKNVNSDRFFEFMLRNRGLSTDLASMSKEDFEKLTVGPSSIRSKAKEAFKTAFGFYLAGRLGLLIDGTGDDSNKIIEQAQNLKDEFGYDVSMVFVNTPLEKAIERNNARPRKLPESLVISSWKEAQKAKAVYKDYFKESFVEAINDKDVAVGEPVDIDPTVHKFAKSFISKPIKNPIGLKWLQSGGKMMEIVNEEKYKIYCDMDGVLVDFPKKWEADFGKNPKLHKKEIGKEEFDDLLDSRPYEWWVNLDPMPSGMGGMQLWKLLSKHDTTILSSPAESEGSRKAKADWLRKHNINAPLILKKSTEKQLYAAPNHILIDDYIRNIEQWRAKGGIGIHHKDNVSTFAELKKLGIV